MRCFAAGFSEKTTHAFSAELRYVAGRKIVPVDNGARWVLSLRGIKQFKEVAQKPFTNGVNIASTFTKVRVLDAIKHSPNTIKGRTHGPFCC